MNNNESSIRPRYQNVTQQYLLELASDAMKIGEQKVHQHTNPESKELIRLTVEFHKKYGFLPGDSAGFGVQPQC